ncbi:unnamed protein product [Blepharisma stoltei]|uniref:Uncharacterized protein n=1 Tax=Blepharisma stoltei TaxID=1481888 RepID=A0AAU9IXJ2_9CILI|nr:unnamed protein product [Blepharisma stoltei]
MNFDLKRQLLEITPFGKSLKCIYKLFKSYLEQKYPFFPFYLSIVRPISHSININTSQYIIIYHITTLSFNNKKSHWTNFFNFLKTQLYILHENSSYPWIILA